MTDITIFGSGNMGKAIGAVLARGGRQSQYVSSREKPEQILGDIVVLAVPFRALAKIAEDYAAELSGKIVVDITNPVNFSSFDSLLVPSGSSAAAQLQAALPSSTILKAFNTNFAATLLSGTVGAEKTTVLIAGDDASAKDSLRRAVEEGGLQAIDTGPLACAHELEAIGFLQLRLAVGEKIGWNAGFTLVR